MILIIVVILIASFLSVVMTYLTIAEKDLLTATVYMSLIGISYTLIYCVLMAPDIALAYVPISTALLPVMIITILKKTKRYEE